MTTWFGSSPGPDGLRRACELVRTQLHLDVVAIGELVDDRLFYRATAGDALRFGIALGAGPKVDERYRRGLDSGRLLEVIADLGAEERRIGLPMVAPGQPGAYVGVPLRTADGDLYGAFFGLRRSPDANLGPRDAELLTIIGGLLVDDLTRCHRLEQARRHIERTLEYEDVELAYQPIFDAMGGPSRGLEALARFPSPLGGPDETFGLAQQVGLGFDLERLIARKALAFLAAFPSDRFLSVNLTPETLLQLAHRARGRDDIPLERLVVEITEHAAVPSYRVLRDELEPLRRQGLRIAIDDAGAGYASLRHVVELRPDFIKVDHSLSHRVADDHARLVAVSAFVILALDIGATVIAEGVERRVDLEALGEAGVGMVQGYLLGMPTTDLRRVAKWLGSPVVDT